MNPINFKGAKIIGQPKDWNPEKDGECVGLPAEVSQLSSGMLLFTSIWKFTDEERAHVAGGHNLAISCFSAQVPIMLSTTDIDGEIIRFAHEADELRKASSQSE